METNNLTLQNNLTAKSEASSSYQSLRPSNNEHEKKELITATVQDEGTLSENIELTPEKLEKVAQQLQSFVSDMNKSLLFQVDEDSGRNVIKVIDRDSGDLVKQYPSEEVLGIVSNLAEATGVLVDFKV